MSSFPNKIWDGCTQTRPDLDTTSAPDYTDWVAIVHEIQAMEEYILSLAGNIEVMPDLRKKTEAASLCVTHLISQIGKVKPPENLIKRLKVLEAKIADMASKGEIDKNHRKVAALQKQVFGLHREIRQSDTAVRDEMDSFKNEVRNKINALQLETHKKLKVVTDRLVEISEMLSFEGLE